MIEPTPSRVKDGPEDVTRLSFAAAACLTPGLPTPITGQIALQKASAIAIKAMPGHAPFYRKSCVISCIDAFMAFCGENGKRRGGGESCSKEA